MFENEQRALFAAVFLRAHFENASVNVDNASFPR